MSDPITTKIELVIEAVEDLANAIFDGRNAPSNCSPEIRDKVAGDILNARAQLGSALRDFLQPMFHVLQPHQEYTSDTNEKEMPCCDVCHRHFICADMNCPDWHAAVRKSVDEAPPARVIPVHRESDTNLPRGPKGGGGVWPPWRPKEPA